jgi:hypothetical protein
LFLKVLLFMALANRHFANRLFFQLHKVDSIEYMATLIDALAQYIEVLSRSAQATTRAEDRSTYTGHLAAAAKIFACLHSGRLSEAKEIVSEQRRSYGWGFLSGDEGSAASTAFDRFATIVESSHAA